MVFLTLEVLSDLLAADPNDQIVTVESHAGKSLFDNMCLATAKADGNVGRVAKQIADHETNRNRNGKPLERHVTPYQRTDQQTEKHREDGRREIIHPTFFAQFPLGHPAAAMHASLGKRDFPMSFPKISI